MTPPIFGITGWKNSGKTTLTVRLVTEFTRRGFRVSTVKHAHVKFEIDREGKDSYRHQQAGAHEVAIVSPLRWALMHEMRGGPPPHLDAITARMSPCDLLLVEGYKGDGHPKIEARRTQARDHKEIARNDPNIVAIAADHPVNETRLPVFDIDEIGPIADFIQDHLKLGKNS